MPNRFFAGQSNYIEELNELDGETSGHIADTTGAHAATAISNTPAGNIAATTVQAAINELDTEKLSASATTLPASFTASSLTSVGTLTALTVSGNGALGDAEATDTHAIKGATTLLANSANAALAVTQTGAGNAFVVEDVASDTTPFVIDGAGLVAIAAATGITGAALTIGGGATSSNLDAFAPLNSASGFAQRFFKSRNTSVYGNTIVQSGDVFGAVQFFGADGTNYVQGASIFAFVDGTPGTNDMPGRLVFSTTADGASTPTERMRIDNAGVVTIGATPGAESLRVIPVASAANAVSVTGATTGNDATLGTVGSDANRALVANTAGTGAFKIKLNSVEAARFSSASTIGGYWDFKYVSAINELKLYTAGAAANLGFSSSGGGEIRFYTNDILENQVTVLRTANASRQLTLTGSNGGNPAIGASAGGVQFTAIPIVPSYTVSTLPAAGTAGGQIYVSNESGGAVLAFSDATNWRRVTDRAIVS